MITQELLISLVESGKTPVQALEQLTAETAISAKVYESEGVVLLSYDQIESPKTNPMVIECRSLILNLEDFSVASRKFDRFFNAGEAPDTLVGFNLARAIAYEKADGSLIGFWFCKGTGRWEISTRGMAFAEGPHVMGGTFRDHILQALGVTEEQFQVVMNEFADPGITIVGEYIGPDNKIVTRYEAGAVVFTGVSYFGAAAVSDIVTLQKYAEFFSFEGFRVREPKVYPAQESLEAFISAANELPNLEEGFVLYDPISNKRVKVKGATYLTAHRLRGNDPVPTRKNMLELVLEGEVEEFILYFPEWTEMVRSLESEIENFLRSLESVYAKASGIREQKEFALAVKDTPGSSYMFNARKLGCSVRHAFNVSPLTQKMKQFAV